MEEIDIYELFEIPHTASKKEIGTAYRQKSLKCHPDKVKDNDDQFIKLTKAYELLNDPERKKEYDTKYKSNLKRKIMLQQLDSKRRQDRQDLETREKESKRVKLDQESKMDMNLIADLMKLRNQGFLLMKERELKQKQLHMDVSNAATNISLNIDVPVGKDATLIVKWKRKVCRLNDEEIESQFTKLGASHFIISSKKEALKGTAIVEFSSIFQAYQVKEKKIGDLDEFEMIWAKGFEPDKIEEIKRLKSQSNHHTHPILSHSNISSTQNMKFDDYEMQTLLRMKNAHKQKMK